MSNYFNSTIAEAIGTTLLHSLWQGAIAALVIVLGSYLIRKSNSALRYWFNISVLGLFLLISLVTLGFLLSESAAINPASNGSALSQRAEIVNEPINLVLPTTNLMDSLSPYFLMFWLLGMLFFSVRLTINYWKSKLLLERNLVSTPDEVLAIMNRLRTHLKISRLVRVLQSKEINTPSVIGHIKPVILFPIGLLNGLSAQQVEAILLHELSHIKRNDFLINILQSMVEVIYFFNPFVWMVSAAIRIERENASDDTALRHGVAKDLYINTLADVYKHAYYKQGLQLALGYNNKNTLKRIQRIMKTQSNNNNKLLTSTVFMLIVSAVIYFNAESHAPAMSGLPPIPTQPVLASPFPSLILDLAQEKEKVVPPVQTSPKKLSAIKPPKVVPVVMPVDTIDHEEMERQAEELERAVEKLYATEEYKELEKLKKEINKEQMKHMYDMSPAIEDALRHAEKSMRINEEELRSLEKKIARITEEMATTGVNEEVDRALELSMRAMEESMREVETQMEQLNIEEKANLARVYAENIREIEVEMEPMLKEMTDKAEALAQEAKVYAKEAEKMSVEAKKQAEKVNQFLDELKPMLIQDGYIKSESDLDNLKFDNGKVWVNDTEVKPKDAKRYNKIRAQYFDEDDDFIMN